jgi:hypothetical protein
MPRRAVGTAVCFLGRPTVVVLAALAALAVSPTVPGTQATLTARATNGANAVATTALYAPTSLAAAPSGHDVQLSWPAGANGSGYSLRWAANGTSSSCAGATLAALATPSGTTHTDTGRYTPEGTYVCYEVQTTYASNWTSVQGNPRVAVQIGHVATSVQIANDGNHAGCSGSGAGTYGQAGRLDCGDQIVLTFNQPLDPTSVPTNATTVCARQSNDTIWLGSTDTTGTCAATETVHLGKLTGGTIGSCNCRFAAAYALSNANKTLTVTVGARTAGSSGAWPTVSTSTWSFTPTTVASKLKSATGGFHVCDSNAGGGNCLPAAPAGTF